MSLDRPDMLDRRQERWNIDAVAYHVRLPQVVLQIIVAVSARLAMNVTLWHWAGHGVERIKSDKALARR
jgi:hypothetical protein